MNTTKSYSVTVFGYMDRCVWHGESKEEVLNDVLSTYNGSGHDPEDIPEAKDILVEELAYNVEFPDGCPTLEEISVAMDACDHAPSGFHDCPDDDTHTTYTYYFNACCSRWKAVAYISNWDPDYGYDPDGECGSFDIDTIEVFRD